MLSSRGRVSWNDSHTCSCQLRIVNCTHQKLAILWVSCEGEEKGYRDVQPHSVGLQATYSTHVWRLRDDASKALVAEHVGGNTTLLIEAKGVTMLPGIRPDVVPTANVPKEWGAYRTRLMTPMGICITAWDCVPDEAISAADHILGRLLQHTPPDIVQRMVDVGTDVAIIGRNQVTSDIPAHKCLKGKDAVGGGRTFDNGCRGVGGHPGIPTTSVGEENLTMSYDKWYSQENILIHEFSHAVMDIGLAGSDHRKGIVEAHRAALAAKLYDPKCYMASSPQEYWAEGAQSWFDATVRTDVNCGINTREKLKNHDPALAKLLTLAYGDDSWRYPQTAPQAFYGASPQPQHRFWSSEAKLGRTAHHHLTLPGASSSGKRPNLSKDGMKKWVKGHISSVLKK